MRYIRLIMIIFIAVICVGCQSISDESLDTHELASNNDSEHKFSMPDTDEPKSNNNSEHEFSMPESAEKEKTKEELTVNIPGLKMNRQAIYYIGRGYLQRKDYSTDYRTREFTAHVIKDIDSGSFYLLVNLYDRYLTSYLGNYFDADSQGMIACADVDGDGDDEIVLSMEINGNRATIARIYKIENNSVILMADFNEAWYKDEWTSEYGYEYRFLDNRYIELTNRFTGLHSVNDLYLVFEHMPFDEEVLNNAKVEFRKFDARLQVDITSSGEVRLKYLQQLRMIDGPSTIGYIVTTLSYDRNSDDFIVCGAEFVFNKCFYNWEV